MMPRWNRREWILGWLTLAIALLGATFWLGEPKAAAWREHRLRAESLARRADTARQLVEREDLLRERLQVFRTQLPRHEADARVTATLLREIETLAREHELTLLRREPQEEKELADLSEVALVCTWEGTLEALVHFLYAVQQRGAMLDVRLLHVHPARTGGGRLQGSFTVDCAFSRGVGEGPEPAGQRTEEG